MLTQYIPSEQELDSKFVRNFRLRVAYFLAKNPNYNDLTYEQINGLLSEKYVTEEEHKVLDNPITKICFRDMLRKAMSQNLSTCEALAYAQKCKLGIPGFDFKIRLDKYNHPDAIIWMTQ